jgi:protein TonB
MPTLQLRLNEYKKRLESAAPPDKAPHEAIEPLDRPAVEPNTLGLVLPIPASRKNGNGMPLTLPPTAKGDVFLNALLEMPTTKQTRRSPLEWAGAMALHLAILATLIIIPLYTTGTIALPDYDAVPLIAPPPPAPPPPPAAATVPRVAHRPRTELTYKLHRLIVPTAIPKKVSLEGASAAPPDVEGVVGGVPGGVVGGQIGGIVGGVLGGTGPGPAPAPVQKSAPKLVRVGSNLKAPRQTYSVDPEYPPLARQARIHGTVLVDAIIDEHGNVVQAHAISGHPLLIPAALRAVLQWKYEPTSLNGQPISVALQVSVTFK